MLHACVIGAGVSGLTTALSLIERGVRTRVVAADWGESTTSAVAGAVWLPYQCDPPAQVNAWALETHRWLSRLATESPEAGVDILTMYESAPTEATPWWRDAVPPEVSVERVPMTPIRPGVQAWRFPVPRVDPRDALPWLQDQLVRAGAVFEQRRVDSLARLLAEHEEELLINCAGLGARSLAGDRSMEARLGQLVLVEPGAWDTATAASDETRGVAYVIPRRRGVMVLGGCSEVVDPDAPHGPEDRRARLILDRADNWGTPHGRVLGGRVGLRPWRPSVRLEQDPHEPRLFHNYGHGGAGWTLCRGCAEEIASLALRAVKGEPPPAP